MHRRHLIADSFSPFTASIALVASVALVALVSACSSADEPAEAAADIAQTMPPPAETPPSGAAPDGSEMHATSSDAGPGATADASAAGDDPCASLPPRDCTKTAAECSKLVPFTPVTGPGYDNYPLNGETAQNQYRSYARVDLMMLVKYAAAYTACKATGSPGGNGGPLGLGDMSEANGAIPGTSTGSPGHPAGTHVNGRDMDIAYFQKGTADNKLRAVCPHTTNGADQYHCTAAPTMLDLDRTTVFLGALLSSPRVRVIGVDGKVGPLVTSRMPALCASGVLPQAACARASLLAFETTDTGRGWYRFHHHHLHVSLSPLATGFAAPQEDDLGALQYGLVAPDHSRLDDFLRIAPHVAGHGKTLD